MAVPIESLAVIGNRKTLAMISKEGVICWYCPERFDYPSLFASLLDEVKGGEWSLKWEDCHFQGRKYEKDSAILQSTFLNSRNEENKVLDFMPAGKECPDGICRIITSTSSACSMEIKPAPGFGAEKVEFEQFEEYIRINGKFFLYSSSVPEIIENRIIRLNIPAGGKEWVLLLDDKLPEFPDPEQLLSRTRSFWEEVDKRFSYHGPYEKAVAQSIRAIRLLTHSETGGVLAAGTTSIPEIAGENRNYDYRYVWLRDAAMIVSALTRAGSDGTDERNFLSFICGLERIQKHGTSYFAPMYNLDYQDVPKIKPLELDGYLQSRPVVTGNIAHGQLQLDTSANVLLAAKVIYNKFDTREHWKEMAETADFLADSWQREDYGIWEETEPRQYTTSKVISAVALSFLAKHSDNKSQRKKWLDAEKEIRAFVDKHCLTSGGAYAAAAGEEAVDVSAILFSSWAYTQADTAAMQATARVLEEEYKVGKLYRRQLFEADSREEGAFLAGSLWMAQYWVYRKELEKATEILQEVLKYSTDLGFFSEVADVKNQRMLGNIPQTFVHASLIGMVIDLKAALEEREGEEG